CFVESSIPGSGGRARLPAARAGSDRYQSARAVRHPAFADSEAHPRSAINLNVFVEVHDKSGRGQMQSMRAAIRQATCLSFVFGLGMAPTMAGAEPLSLTLDWTPFGVHAPVFLAAQKGW